MNKRSYEIIGLKHWNEVLGSLEIAIPLAAAGFLLCYLVWWRQKEHSNSRGLVLRLLNLLGFIGILMIIASLWYFLPLIAWVEAIISGIMTVILSIFIFFVVVFFCWSWISKNIRR